MIKGYFPHKLPDLIPTAYGFAFVLGMLGLRKDPMFDAHWSLVSHIRRGIYQRPIVNSIDDAFKHSAFLNELCSFNNPAWNDMPLVLNILVPNVDLTFINTWCEQIINGLHPKEKPLLFTTLQHWKDLQKGPNAEYVSKGILGKADILLSQYRVSLPDKPLYVEKLKYWEYEDGKMQFAVDGIFEKVAVPVDTTPAEEPEPLPGNDPADPPAGGQTSLSSDLTIHLVCPKCNQRIF